MAQTPLALRLLLLAALGVHSSASTRPPAILSRGQDFCSANALQRCSNDLSVKFCCPKGSSCLSLAGGTTVLCCPDDRNCDKIQPITCNAREQDPDKNPKAPIKTSVFDTPLERCGKDLCCPFGPPSQNASQGLCILLFALPAEFCCWQFLVMGPKLSSKLRCLCFCGILMPCSQVCCT